MSSFSRRQLANYAVDQIVGGQTAKLAERLASVLIVSKRQKEVDLLMSDINQILEDRGLRAKAMVTASQPLNDELREQITEAVKKLASVKKVKLEETIDKDLIGGIRVETANHSWDKSLKSQLNRLEAASG